eukprot:gene24238-biopygen2894
MCLALEGVPKPAPKQSALTSFFKKKREEGVTIPPPPPTPPPPLREGAGGSLCSLCCFDTPSALDVGASRGATWRGVLRLRSALDGVTRELPRRFHQRHLKRSLELFLEGGANNAPGATVPQVA